jgi:hypothetical protein
MNEIKAEGPLMAELARRPTLGTFQQFMRKVEEFVNLEETISVLTKKKVKREEEEDKEKEFSTKKKRKTPKMSEKRVEPFQGRNQSQGQRWTPLNATLSIVFMEFK